MWRKHWVVFIYRNVRGKPYRSRLNVVLNLFNKIKKTQNFQLERGCARATGPKLNATLQFLASGSFQDIMRFYVVPQTFANI